MTIKPVFTGIQRLLIHILHLPLLLVLIMPLNLLAQKSAKLNFIDQNDKWSYNFQFTTVGQYHGSFKSPYSGLNSLSASQESAISLTSTLFLGRRLWKGASFYINPEMAGGNGVSAAHGIAAFANGETFRVGNPAPVPYFARAFIRQHFHLKGDFEDQDEDINRCSEKLSKNRIVITLGKFSLADIFDNNSVSHDSRVDFLNWGLMNNGAWDYPANTRGYTSGIVMEYYRLNWAFRTSAALVATSVNGPIMDLNIKKAHGFTFEIERNYKISTNEGKIRLLFFVNNSKAASYTSVVNEFTATKDSSKLNVYNSNQYLGLKYGVGINFEQKLSKKISGFSRLAWNDGKTGIWAFAEIEQTISMGFKIKGPQRKRPHDIIGIAGIVNGLSQSHIRYLNAGGYGFMIGDGKLPHYGIETIFEGFYAARVATSLYLTIDYQFVANPAYNMDRGPVHLFASRIHFQFN